ncbi:putative aminodeoxychorismate synthase, partial [Termitomyces sp. T112]
DSLASACRRLIPSCVIFIIKNDDLTIQELLPYLPYFSAIIVGPGPGSPDNPHDIGIVGDIWKVEDAHLLPIFGVCLGLQSLGVEFGARLQRLCVVKHGHVSTIHHSGTNLFKGSGSFDAVRYHSLHVVLAKDGELEELAWTNDENDNGHIVMAARHRIRPFWAVQYHPESFCTQREGAEVLENFWHLAQEWTKINGRNVRPWDASSKHKFRNPWPPISSPLPLLSPSLRIVQTTVLGLPGVTATAIAEIFGAMDDDLPFAMLDSAAKPGRFSIVAALLPTSLQITYNIQDNFLTLKRGKVSVREELGGHDVWSWLASFMRAQQAEGCPEIPFWGGLVGQLSYELGVQGLHIPTKSQFNPTNRHPDVNLIFVERSIVLDSVSDKVYIQSLLPGDDAWISETSTRLLQSAINVNPSTSISSKVIPPPVIMLPDRARYIARINQAKDKLFAGDSYELCVTANTHVSIPGCSSSTPTSWERYKLLRRMNPAPHSAFLRLHPSTFLSSSPERFLSYSRPPDLVCQLRPIKGTVRKVPGITRAVAEELLANSRKEVAENLMIVDLIRHDLHGVIGDGVQVKQFCGVEEYETVWQLVSVIEGKEISNAACDADSNVGWEVLRQCLPPGSMTGAPKKRSVEILQTLEDEERNLYSGVFGYWCVGGGGDWSVAIRSCSKYDHPHRRESTPSSWTEEWTIGAGGAITALSDPNAEWDEMILKLQSVLNSFDVHHSNQ